MADERAVAHRAARLPVRPAPTGCPAGLTMPRALHVVDLDDSSAAIWLPGLDVVAPTGRRPTTRGRRTCSAGSPPAPRSAERAASATPTAGRVCDYANGRLDQVASGPARGRPLAGSRWVAAAFDADLRDADARRRSSRCRRWSTELEAAADRRPPTATPARTTCCGTTGSTTSCSSTSASGAAARRLRPRSAARRRRPDRPPRRADLAGPRRPACRPTSAGWRRRARRRRRDGRRRAHALHLMIFTGLSAALADPPAPGAQHDALAHDARERAAIARFCLGLVEATSSCSEPST